MIQNLNVINLIQILNYINERNNFILIILLGKQIQYPSLDCMHNNIAKSRLKSFVNNDLISVKSKLDFKDNYSSEEELDAQELTRSQIARPMFDRSTKVL